MANTFLDFLAEMTYDKDAPHYGALQNAKRAAMETGSNALIVRKFDRETKSFHYVAVPSGQQLPAGYDIWAEVNARGKLRRVGNMY